MKIVEKIFQGAKTRLKIVIVLAVIVMMILFGLYRYHSKTAPTAGGSAVTGVPDISSVPGAKGMSPEYLKLLMKSNKEAAEKALKAGKSNIPTLINVGDQAATSQLAVSGSCQVFCNRFKECNRCTEEPNTSSMLDQMVQSGNVSPVVAAQLKKLASDGMSVSDYAAHLNKLVKEGRLTPEQARKLLAAYQKEHAKLSPDKLTDQLLSSGQISSDVASQLKKLNTSGDSPDQYQAALNKLVKEGKLTPAQAKALMAAYRKKHKTLSPDDLADQLVATGQLSPAVASQLHKLNSAGLTPDQYQAALNKLVKEGKLTPAQAKALMSAYRNKHKVLTSDGLVGQMDAAGHLLPAVASQLKALAKKELSPSDYKKALDKLVKEGKLTPEQEKGLLNAYNRKHGLMRPSDLADQMAASGQISPAIAAEVKNLAHKNLSPSDYKKALDKLVKEGKLTPAQERALLSSYNAKHKVLSPDDLADQMVASGQLSAATADEVKNLAHKNLSPSDYKKALDKLVKEGKLTPAQERALLSSYNAKHKVLSPDDLADQMVASGQLSAADEVKNLAHKNLSPSDYKKALDKLVKEGKLTPAQERALLSSYNAKHKVLSPDDLADQMVASGQLSAATADEVKNLAHKNLSPSDYKKALDKLVKEGKLTPAQERALLGSYNRQHAAAPEEVRAVVPLDEATAAEQAKTMPQYQAAIQSQAQALTASWNPIPQTFVGAAEPTQPGKAKSTATSDQTGGTAGGSAIKTVTKRPMIKAATIMFAVLDTSVNTDQPGPVMATMVSGKFKGAKLMGSLTQTPDGTRVMLKFNQMVKKEWPENVTINAVAINPDTAHTAVASNVDHHYLLRWGSLFAGNFIQGVAKAVMTSGTSNTSSAGTTTASHPAFSAGKTALVGLGQIGEKIAKLASKWVDKPPTVKVDAGVGLGILFLADVPKPAFLK